MLTRAKQAVRDAQHQLRLVRLTGQLRPDHVPLAASGHVVFVDRDDLRGLEIVRGLGRGHQPALIALWQQLVTTLDPGIVIDVGANYGELVVNGRYEDGTRVLAVEANPRIVPLLRRSLAAHPDAARIELHDVLAGDRDGGTEQLRVDLGWSGTAGTSLATSRTGKGLVEVTVPVRTLDALVGADAQAQTRPLVVKIDTEGSEAKVLRGMASLLAGAPAVAALVEFVPSCLERSGTDPDDLFATLRSMGRCWTVDWHGRTNEIHAAPEGDHDVLVLSDDALAERLGLPAA